MRNAPQSNANAPMQPARPDAPLDFATFTQRLPKKVDPGKLKKSLAMLKAERFQLFADVSDQTTSSSSATEKKNVTQE